MLSALGFRDYISSTGHSAAVEHFCILDNASTELDLFIHESFFILRYRPTFNQQNSSIPLYLFLSPQVMFISFT